MIFSTRFSKKSTLVEKYKSPRKEKRKSDVLFLLFSLGIIGEKNAKNIKISKIIKKNNRLQVTNISKISLLFIFSTRFSKKSTLVEKYKSPRKEKREREKSEVLDEQTKLPSATTIISAAVIKRSVAIAGSE